MKAVLNPTTDQWSELTARPTAPLDDVMPFVDEVFGAFNGEAIRPYSSTARSLMAIDPSALKLT